MRKEIRLRYDEQMEIKMNMTKNWLKNMGVSNPTKTQAVRCMIMTSDLPNDRKVKRKPKSKQWIFL